jgi:hypothetical protein
MKPAWRNRIVGQGEEAPDQLLANPANWRTHPKAQRDALRGSLAEIGWVQQVIVNRTTGHLVDGHARVEEAISAKAKKIPVLYVELTPEEERLVLASLDPLGAMAQADNAKLGELLTGLEAATPALRDLLESLGAPSLQTLEARMAEWQGMPEFDQPDRTAWKSVIVHFRNAEDLAAFWDLLKQKPGMGPGGSIWFPEAEIGRLADKRYVPE